MDALLSNATATGGTGRMLMLATWPGKGTSNAADGPSSESASPCSMQTEQQLFHLYGSSLPTLKFAHSISSNRRRVPNLRRLSAFKNRLIHSCLQNRVSAMKRATNVKGWTSGPPHLQPKKTLRSPERARPRNLIATTPSSRQNHIHL